MLSIFGYRRHNSREEVIYWTLFTLNNGHAVSKESLLNGPTIIDKLVVDFFDFLSF